MPAVANPITFGGSSRDYGYNPPSRVGFDDLPYLQTPGGARGVPTYTVGGGSGKPIRPGVGLGTGKGTTIVSGSSPISYNPNTRSGSFDVADGEYGPVSTEDMIKAAAKNDLLQGTVGTVSTALLGQNLMNGAELGSGFLGQIPYLGQGLRNLNYAVNPSIGSAYNANGIGGVGKHLFDNFNYGDTLKFLDPNLSGTVVDGVRAIGPSISSGVASLASKIPQSVIQNLPGNTAMTFSPLGGGMPISPGILNKTKAAAASNAASNNPGFLGSVGNFFNQSRSFIPGVSGTGASATGFGGGGVPGQGITSIGNVLGTVGGLFSLADFIDDPSLASGLGTLAGAGASGIGAFSGLATAAPWLAGAALVASLLGNKKPSNKTGYTSIDLDEFKPVSFGMEGKKYSKENVDQTMQIMEPIIPAIQQLEEQYGVDLKGDIQVNYGGRDGLAYNIGNRDVTGFRNRLDYFDGRDQSTRDGGSIFRKTFKGENAGKDFYTSLLGDLEALAKQKQADGGGEIDLANYRGVQRQAPQMTGAFSYGLPGGTPNVATPPKPKGGPQGVFTYGYNT
tara:strand:+ start:3659 stop:5347 length:1689 start_codon:yes stop_codon:yes gene_type:complete